MLSVIICILVYLNSLDKLVNQSCKFLKKNPANSYVLTSCGVALDEIINFLQQKVIIQIILNLLNKLFLK